MTDQNAKNQSERKPQPPRNGLSVITTRLMTADDIPAMMHLTYDFTLEFGVAHRYDAKHNADHMRQLYESGVGIMVCENAIVIGGAIFKPIDTGYEVMEDAMESAHIVIQRDKRSMKVARALFAAVRHYSNETGRKLLLHQLCYPCALAGSTEQTKRVSELYKYLEFPGTYGVTHLCAPDKDDKPK